MNYKLSDKSSIKNIARDIASLGEIRARIISDKAINSLNFSIDVVNDKAYLIGVAKDKAEMMTSRRTCFFCKVCKGSL